MRLKRSRIILIAVAVFFLVVIMDALGVFDTKPYMEVPHGNHTHYVPRNADPDVPLDDFPMTPPGPNERITPEGKIVPK
ncbi:MAG TPA: hypothetical protein VFG50_10635 [Rhodothermales bacterium]|nr:hypothetical protein [Rhodothermales bacterium]